MSQSVLEQLLEMGFEKQMAELAVKKSDGCMYLRLLRLPRLPIPTYVMCTYLGTYLCYWSCSITDELSQCQTRWTGWRSTRIHPLRSSWRKKAPVPTLQKSMMAL